MDKRWRNLIAIVIVLALAGAAYYFFFSNQPGTNGISPKLDSTLSKYGLSRADFKGSLPLDTKAGTLSPKMSVDSIPQLKRDLTEIESQAKSRQDKDLVALYLEAVTLTGQEYGILQQVNQLGDAAQAGTSAQVCGGKAKMDSLSLDYDNFYVSANALAMADLNYSKEYNTQRQLSLDLNNETDMMNSIAGLDSVYAANCAGDLNA